MYLPKVPNYKFTTITQMLFSIPDILLIIYRNTFLTNIYITGQEKQHNPSGYL